jgi:hypothetical protein
VILDKGVTMTPSFSEYLLPTSMDVPDVQTILIESGDGVGPFGAKGVGEPSVCSVAPAIANAVYDAIGVRIFDLPITPEKMVRELEAKSRRQMIITTNTETRKIFVWGEPADKGLFVEDFLQGGGLSRSSRLRYRIPDSNSLSRTIAL